VVVAVVLALLGVPGVASAAPVDPGDSQLGVAEQAQTEVAAEVGRVGAQLAAAQAELEQVNAVAMAAADAQLVAEAELGRAQQAATDAAAALVSATAAAALAQDAVDGVAVQTYMRSGDLGGLATLLYAEDAGQLLQQAATLEFLAAQRSDVLTVAEDAQVAMANADSQARAAVDAQTVAAQQAQTARAEADAQLARSQTSVADLASRSAGLAQQLQDAQIRLLQLQGQRNAYQVWLQQQAAAEAARTAPPGRSPSDDAPPSPAPTGGRASSSPVTAGSESRITNGRFTSCYEMRWGTMHNGVDIAAPIGTPIYAPADGRVVRAGAATGFGLAVYIQHDDGSVTVYGHINDYFVTTGERVTAGQVIAEVGNRGQSTGPHVHVEVHAQGVYQGRTNPMPWLRARGVEMASPCT
jgi:murein DD-endopeptidase MepM/ murein hydrolase activator NlpD